MMMTFRIIWYSKESPKKSTRYYPTSAVEWVTHRSFPRAERGLCEWKHDDNMMLCKASEKNGTRSHCWAITYVFIQSESCLGKRRRKQNQDKRKEADFLLKEKRKNGESRVPSLRLLLLCTQHSGSNAGQKRMVARQLKKKKSCLGKYIRRKW